MLKLQECRNASFWSLWILVPIQGRWNEDREACGAEVLGPGAEDSLEDMSDCSNSSHFPWSSTCSVKVQSFHGVFIIYIYIRHILGAVLLQHMRHGSKNTTDGRCWIVGSWWASRIWSSTGGRWWRLTGWVNDRIFQTCELTFGMMLCHPKVLRNAKKLCLTFRQGDRSWVLRFWVGPWTKSVYMYILSLCCPLWSWQK